MNKIKNVLLCGLGGVGCVCASAMQDKNISTFKVLVDKERYKRYKKTPTTFNSKSYNFDYILPDNRSFKADLIIIATKNDGLDTAIGDIKNFIDKNTIIISVLNGIHSERKIIEKYNTENTLISFYIGNSCIRDVRNIYQDGNYELFIGSKDNNQDDAVAKISTFFKEVGIKHKVSTHIMERYWKKFMVNVGLNQLCAVHNITFKELKKDLTLIEEMKKLIWEVKLIAEKEGINNPQKLYDDTIKFLIEDFEDATPSMLQDIRAGRKTEVDIFAGEIIRLGSKYKIETPFNEKIYRDVKRIENEKKILATL